MVQRAEPRNTEIRGPGSHSQGVEPKAQARKIPFSIQAGGLDSICLAGVRIVLFKEDCATFTLLVLEWECLLRLSCLCLIVHSQNIRWNFGHFTQKEGVSQECRWLRSETSNPAVPGHSFLLSPCCLSPVSAGSRFSA